MNDLSVFITTCHHLCMIVGKGQRMRRHKMPLCAKLGKHFLSHPYVPAARMIAILCVQSIPLVCFREPFMWLVWDRPLLTVPLILSK